MPGYINTTPYDPPFPADNTIESLLIPFPAIFKGIKLARAARGVVNAIPEGKLANHLFKGANKMSDTPCQQSYDIQSI